MTLTLHCELNECHSLGRLDADMKRCGAGLSASCRWKGVAQVEYPAAQPSNHANDCVAVAELHRRTGKYIGVAADWKFPVGVGCELWENRNEL